MSTAWSWAERGTCSRLHVGCVVARGSRSVASGYNGAPPGLPHCVHRLDEDAPCREATHAEANALAFAARYGVSTDGATVYTTHSPCAACAALVIAAGVSRVVYGLAFRDTAGIERLEEAGVEVAQVR